MTSTLQSQSPHSSVPASESPISLTDTLSATPTETFVPGSELMFPPDPVGFEPEFGALEQLWGVIAFPYDHPIQTLFGLGFFCAIAFFMLMERRTGINPIDRLHALFNPYCACHRCNPKFRRQHQAKASKTYRTRSDSTKMNPFN